MNEGKVYEIDLWFLLEGAIRDTIHLLKEITKASIQLYLDTLKV